MHAECSYPLALSGKFDKINLQNPKNVTLYLYVQEMPVIESTMFVNQLICTIGITK